MTREAKKSLYAAAGVLACICSVCGGAIWRDRLELGSRGSSDIRLSNLVASTSTTADLPETMFFDDMMELLKRKYVEPVTDDTKLADGAVRGMVASLGDPNSLYMDASQFAAYSNTRVGKYEGVGLHCVLERDRSRAKVTTGAVDELDAADTRFPLLIVALVVPGSSADKAGLRVGDVIESVDGRWIPNSSALDELERLSQLTKDHKLPGAEYLKRRAELRELLEKSVIAIKARDRLMMGSVGSIEVKWSRRGEKRQATLSKGSWSLPGFGVDKTGVIRLPFATGDADKLAKALTDLTDVTIDLRNNLCGDFDAMLACLRLVAPRRIYGVVSTHKDEKPWPIEVTTGISRPINLTLLADSSTRGTAAIFVRALASRGVAKLIGEPAGDLFVTRWYSLPDGGGYTLVTGEYKPSAPGGIVAQNSTQERRQTR